MNNNGFGSVTLTDTAGGQTLTWYDALDRDYIFVDEDGALYSGSRSCEIAKIVIPEGVIALGYDFFFNCVNLIAITIPSSLVSIDIYSDYLPHCSRLETIVVDRNNPTYDSRHNCNAIVETATNTLLFGCKNSIVPQSVAGIGCGAFFGCTGLASLEIPDSVTIIDAYAFKMCSNLAAISLPPHLKTIGERAFESCLSLTSITIPATVNEIGCAPFVFCCNLSAMIIDKNNPKYDSRDNCNAIIDSNSSTLLYGCKSSTIPNNVRAIQNHTFYFCQGLSHIILPNSLVTIGDYAFDSCPDLTSIYFPGTKMRWKSITKKSYKLCGYNPIKVYCVDGTITI